MPRLRTIVSILAVTALLAGCQESHEPGHAGTEGGDMQIAPDVAARLAKFAPTEIAADLGALSEGERTVLNHLIAASRQMNEIFLRQAWTENPEMRARLAKSDDPLAPAALEYFDISYGPWDRLDEEPFIGQAVRPETAGFYPEGLTADELTAWVAAHPGDEAAFQGLYTVIRRQGNDLVAVPYSQEYREWLEPAAAELRAAADATDNASLAKYLRLVADAFGKDDYYQSDLAWMDLDSPVEVTIGPYETYEDRLMGYKASFEAFVTVVDPDESAKLARYKQLLPDMERNLPIPDVHKNLDRGTESPIRVVDEVFTAGDTRAGVQTVAFNLPNDERVREAKGSKKVMLRNVMDAKFETILRPIAARTLPADQAAMVSADAFFNEVLFHELSHGLGPGKIVKDGRNTEVRLELKELYSAVEEAKADVMGVFNLLYLMDRGVVDASMRQPLLVTYLAGLFRGARFGVGEAHGQGAAMQFQYLLQRDAIQVDEDAGTASVVFERIEDGIRDLVHDICMLQATGDYEGTKKLLDDFGHLSPALSLPLSQLEGIPVDIRPTYPAADG